MLGAEDEDEEEQEMQEEGGGADETGSGVEQMPFTRERAIALQKDLCDRYS